MPTDEQLWYRMMSESSKKDPLIEARKKAQQEDIEAAKAEEHLPGLRRRPECQQQPEQREEGPDAESVQQRNWPRWNTNLRPCSKQ